EKTTRPQGMTANGIGSVANVRKTSTKPLANRRGPGHVPTAFVSGICTGSRLPEKDRPLRLDPQRQRHRPVRRLGGDVAAEAQRRSVERPGAVAALRG